jgi:2-dehydro-3-deoxyphosphogluconate aldolase/(4S)-4-hydroxy-2-oxoglutarate aldolase
MKDEKFSWQLFKMAPIIGIVRSISFEAVKEILPVYYDAGLTTIEITMNTLEADEIIAYASKEYRGRLNVGAGTVCTQEDLDKAISAGASFIVTPIIKKKIIRACVKNDIPIFPGAYTPSEIYKAWSLGASMVKVFPATNLGPDYIKDVKAPLTDVKLVPTGGVNLENIASFFKAGADGAGIGSYLLHKQFIRDKNWAALKDHFTKFLKQLEPVI